MADIFAKEQSRVHSNDIDVTQLVEERTAEIQGDINLEQQQSDQLVDQLVDYRYT